jgi:hypothetical protein
MKLCLCTEGKLKCIVAAIKGKPVTVFLRYRTINIALLITADTVKAKL